MCGKEWTDGEALEVRSPWDQGLVGRVTVATRADARQAVNHAVASLRRTRALPRWKRREILEAVAEALTEQKERFAQLIVAEAGKPVRLARAEVDRTVMTFRTAAEETVRLAARAFRWIWPRATKAAGGWYSGSRWGRCWPLLRSIFR
jgi:acyl-CoA reductase-like NAD-dependent aldehyde dehydrogenase